MQTLLFLTVAIGSQPTAPDLAGDWRAVEMQTAKGAAPVANLEWGLYIEGERFRFVGPEGEATGKIGNPKAGQVDLVTAKGALFCSFTIEGDKLTLAVWGTAANRTAKPSRERHGIILVFTKLAREKGAGG